nr:hypothetical protein CFP56_63376 [Quercus suber]POE94780.1 hypothetical protein CFP56_17017 [Quercus suber]
MTAWVKSACLDEVAEKDRVANLQRARGTAERENISNCFSKIGGAERLQVIRERLELSEACGSASGNAEPCNARAEHHYLLTAWHTGYPSTSIYASRERQTSFHLTRLEMFRGSGLLGWGQELQVVEKNKRNDELQSQAKCDRFHESWLSSALPMLDKRAIPENPSQSISSMRGVYLLQSFVL